MKGIVGAPGEEYWLDLELKLVADMGIIRVANAGKSTFLSAISAAKPKVKYNQYIHYSVLFFRLQIIHLRH